MANLKAETEKMKSLFVEEVEALLKRSFWSSGLPLICIHNTSSRRRRQTVICGDEEENVMKRIELKRKRERKCKYS